MKALILVADGFEDVEFNYPRYRLLEEGFSVDVATPRGREVEGKHGYAASPDLAVDDVDTGEYCLLVIPGGRSPEHLRLEAPGAVEIAGEMVDSGRAVAAICHGPQLLMSAGVLEGRRATCYASVADDLRNAGAEYVDREVVVDGNLVTSRRPEDLPAFAEAVLKNV